MSREILQEIIQRSATDTAFRKRLVHSPGEVLSEAGFDVPEGKVVVILENTDDLIHVVLPHLEGAGTEEPDGIEWVRTGNGLALRGRLDAQGVERVREVFRKWEDNLTVDLGDLTYISSAGLSLLLRTQKRLVTAGFELQLRDLRPAVRNVFILAGFDKLFGV